MAATALCTDEAIAIRVGGDFVAICPKGQKLADEQDGVINGWNLTSSTAGDFSVRGVTAGMMVNLATYSSTKPINELLVVDVVNTTTITLRRQGFASGVGDPPGSPSALTAVSFTIVTMAPQIESVSFSLDREYGIDDLVTGRRNLDLYNPREAEMACVLETACRLYFAAWRAAQNDTFFAKAKALQEEMKELKDRVLIHWIAISGTSGAGTVADSSSKFSTRLVRG